MLRESLGLAFESFAANRLRSFLSLVGIVIGVASVVAVTGIAESGTADVRRQFEAFGLDSVQLFPNWDEAGPKIEFDPALVAELERKIPFAKAVLPRSTPGGRLQAGRRSSEAGIVLVDSRYFAAMGAKVEIGRSFSAEDEYARSRVAVIGAEAARELFPEGSPLGKSLIASIGDAVLSFEVIGVLEKKERRFMDDWDRSAYIPFASAVSRLSSSLGIQSISVLATSRDRVLALGGELEAFFLAKTGKPDAVWIESPKAWAEANAKATGAISAIVTGIAGISLLVGGIGVMNIMLVSVTERKKEIGIRKALGATSRHIRTQFLVEAVLLTLIGGTLGLGLGYAIAALAVKAFGWQLVASGFAAALAFGVSTGTGLFFGLYPAARAARLDPVEALAAE